MKSEFKFYSISELCHFIHNKTGQEFMISYQDKRNMFYFDLRYFVQGIFVGIENLRLKFLNNEGSVIEIDLKFVDFCKEGFVFLSEVEE